jgi:hypothetical protein
LDWFLGLGFLEEFLEKGCSRKRTGIRVARCRKMFGGILEGLRCFAKRFKLEEFELGGFWDFVRSST